MIWKNEFRHRMGSFEKTYPKEGNAKSISIKIRVSSGCYHREHSPRAYRIIDEYLYLNPSNEFDFVEHESGPEILVWVIVKTVVNLTSSVINLVTTIIKARKEGIKQGDRPREELELIIRGFDENGKIKEEKVLKIKSWDDVSKDLIEKSLINSLNRMFLKDESKKKK